MATLEELETGGHIGRYEPFLEHWEMPERHIWLTTDCRAWWVAVLDVAPRVRGRNLSPVEQVEELFYEFVIGQAMSFGVHCRKMDPLGQHVWELRTTDVRVFGWIPRKRHFLAVCGEFKNKLSKDVQTKSTNALYKPYIDKVIAVRNAMPLDVPKSLTGVAINDVL